MATRSVGREGGWRACGGGYPWGHYRGRDKAIGNRCVKRAVEDSALSWRGEHSLVRSPGLGAIGSPWSEPTEGDGVGWRCQDGDGGWWWPGIMSYPQWAVGRRRDRVSGDSNSGQWCSLGQRAEGGGMAGAAAVGGGRRKGRKGEAGLGRAGVGCTAGWWPAAVLDVT